MAKRNITIFAVFSILLFLGLIGWFSYRVATIRRDNIRDAERSYKIIQGELSVLHKLGLGLDTDTLRDRFTELSRRRPPLRALTIYSETAGIYFLKADDSDLYGNVSPGSVDVIKEPVYTVGPTGYLLLRSALPFPAEGLNDFKVDGLYEVLGREDIYPPMQVAIILLACYLVGTGIFLALTPVQKKVSPPPPDKEPAQAQSSPGLYSPNTGLVWQDLLKERLDNELKRAASFDQDLVLGVIRITGMPDGLDPGKIGRLLLDRFPFSDLAFEYGADGFAVIVPNADLDQGIAEFEALIPEVESLVGDDTSVKTAIGLSSRNGRLLEASRLMKEAGKALSKAAEEQDSSIIAFRTDPSKYRDFIASRV